MKPLVLVQFPSLMTLIHPGRAANSFLFLTLCSIMRRALVTNTETRLMHREMELLNMSGISRYYWMNLVFLNL
jgi:hypothetical protein